MMDNDAPEDDQTLPPKSNAASDDDKTVFAADLPPVDSDKTMVAAPLPDAEDDKTMVAAPLPDADSDKTMVAEPQPDRAAIEADDPETPAEDKASDASVPAVAMPQLTDVPIAADSNANGLSSPPVTQAPTDDGLAKPPVTDVPAENTGLSAPPVTEAPVENTGLAAPPVTEVPAENTGLAAPPVTEVPVEDAALAKPPVTEAPTVDAALANPPATEAPTEDAALAQPTLAEAPSGGDGLATPPTVAAPLAQEGLSVPPAAALPKDVADAPEIDPESVPDAIVADSAPDDDAEGGEDRTQIADAADSDDDEIVLPEPSSDPLEGAPAQDQTDVSLAPVSGNDGSPVPMGTMINNNYEIKELISAGGMGEVFRGVNAFTGDAVAIKIVLQSLANDPKIAALFMREAKVLCGLSDNAIVRYFNFVKDVDLDRFCLIMEFIDGMSLSDFVRDERPLTEDEARGLLRRVASGLDRAHKMDVVHRDLSPDNVMLRDGKISEAVLIDFGIAKSQEMAESTLHGQLAGKFKYISPEQLGHFGGEIGPRTDIYGLGLLMAAALRGEPLDMGASVVEAVNARREIPDLSEMPAGLRPLLAHMLEPDPVHRPPRMADVIRLLDHPADIPAKYGGVRPVADGRTQPPGVPPQIVMPTPGLQQPPTTAAGVTMGGVSQIPGGGAESPFGAGSTGVQPGTFAPGVTAAPGTHSPRPQARRGGGLLRWLLVLLLLAGLGGYVGLRQGIIPQEILPEALRTAETGQTGVAEDTPASTPTGPITRAGFLADYDAGPCAYATRLAGGSDAGLIAAFAANPDAFEGLADAFEEVFETRPGIRTTVVPDTHCAALGLAGSLQRLDGADPILTLDSDEMQSGGSIVGRLSDRRGRPVWLILVTTAGGVYNLTDRLTEQSDGSATFSFGLNSDGSGEPQPQLIMVVASDQPLIAAAAANNGARASDLLPLIEAEIVGRQGEAGTALSYFDLMP